MEHQKQRKSSVKRKANTGSAAKKNFDTCNCRAPFVFAIPRVYEDDFARNDSWYFDLQKIERKAKELKEELQQIAQRHSYSFLLTKQMVAASLERRNRLIQKKVA